MQGSSVSSIRQALRFDGLFWRRFMYLGCVYGPEWWKRFSPPFFAAVIFLAVGRNRRASIANVSRVLGEPTRGHATLETFRMWAEFSHCMTETMECYGPRPRPMKLEEPDRDLLEGALARRKGAIFVTGHFGNWDVAAKTLQTFGRPINVVMAREENSTTEQFVRLAHERGGVRIIFSDTSVFSSLNMLNALKRGEILAMQLDRPLGSGSTRVLPFFGAPARFPTGPFVLARLSGAPLIPVFIPRVGPRHYLVRLGGCFHVPRDPRERQTIDRVMLEVLASYEAVIREYPRQWFQFAPFWREPSDSGSRPSSTGGHLESTGVASSTIVGPGPAEPSRLPGSPR